MVESKRFQALNILEKRADAQVSYHVRKAKNASDELSRIENRRPWDFNYITPLQRFLKRRQLYEKLQEAAMRADEASLELERLQASDGLSIIALRKRPMMKRPYDADELVGYINDTYVSIEARRNDGKVTKGHINGVDIKECADRDHAQRVFDAYYPVVLKRDKLAGILQINFTKS